jgi:hypothetical protein
VITRQESAALAVIDEIEALIVKLSGLTELGEWELHTIGHPSGGTAHQLIDEGGRLIATFPAGQPGELPALMRLMWNHSHIILPIARLGVDSVIRTDPGLRPTGRVLKLVAPVDI